MMILGRSGVLHSHEAEIGFLNRMFDVVVVFLCGYLAFFSSQLGSPEIFYLYILLGLTSLGFHFVGEVFGLYRSWRGVGLRKELYATVLIWMGISGGVLALSTFSIPFLEKVSTDCWQWFFLAGFVLVFYRFALRVLLRILRSRGYNTRTVVIVGAGHLGVSLADKVRDQSWMGLSLLGFYDDFKEGSVFLRDKSSVDILGNLHQLVDDAKSGRADRVYITLPMRADVRIKWLVDSLADSCVSVYLIPDIFVFELLHSRVGEVGGIPCISIIDSPFSGFNALLKRVEDIFLSLVIIFLISVPLVFISVGVKVSSPGPVIFRQKRYGIDGREIEVWKFRSMAVMENDKNVVQAKKNDERVTSFGSFLRRTSLDELPQFFNVLMGDMSIVGPRPHAIAHNEMYRKLINGYMLRHKVKPGITGWAQINGWRGETDTLDKMQKRVEFDLDYIRRWSLWLDLKIIASTLLKGFVDKNAY